MAMKGGESEMRIVEAVSELLLAVAATIAATAALINAIRKRKKQGKSSG